MNKVILVGNLTRDPELKTGNSGKNVCNFTLAVNRRFKNANGDVEADFPNIVAFGQTAELVNKYLAKGRKCGVVGRLQTRTYEKDGQKRYVTEVVADEVEFLSSRESGGQSSAAPQQAAPTQEMANQGFTQVDDDDLPF
jgi:single-strand DNA-binding protein